MPLIKPVRRAVARPIWLPPLCRLYAPLIEGSGVATADPRGWTGSLVGAASWASGPWGPEIECPLAVASGVSFGPYIGSANVSVVALAQPTDGSTARSLVGKRANLTGWQFLRNTTGNLAFRAMSTVVNSSLPLPLGQYRALGVSFASGLAATFYALGPAGLAVQSVLTPVIHSPGNEPLWLGAYENAGQPANAWVGRLVAAAVFDGALGESAMVELLHDLWAGRFQGVRAPAGRRLLASVLSGSPPPPPPPPPSATRAVARWFPGLRRSR